MPATLVAALHNRDHRAGCIRHARRADDPSVGGSVATRLTFQNGYGPRLDVHPATQPRAGAWSSSFAILDARATQSVALELLSF